MSALATKLRRLCEFTACDVSDALLKLKVPGSGFLADLHPIHPASTQTSPSTRTAAPAATVLFVPKSATPTTHPTAFHGHTTSNIPPDAHYIDLTRRDTILVLAQPAGQTNAILGGIMALRAQACGAAGLVVAGRVRDRAELATLRVPVWSRATSTVGAGAEAKPWALDVPVAVGGVEVRPGDIIMSDPDEGLVAIPADRLDEVLELMPKLTAADDLVKEDVARGVTVKEAFARHRSAL